MGSKNAAIFHQHGGFLPENAYRLGTHIAWRSYDEDSIPKGALGRDGKPARPRTYFEKAAAAGAVVFPNAKNEAVMLRAIERARKDLVQLGVLVQLERGIPNKRTAMYELNFDCLVKLSNRRSESLSTDDESRQLTQSTDDESRQPVGDSDDERRTYLQDLNSQATKALSEGEFTSGVPRRHSPSPETSVVNSPRGREAQTPPKNDIPFTFDEAGEYLASLSNDVGFHFWKQAQAALGEDATSVEQIIYAAQLAQSQQGKDRP